MASATNTFSPPDRRIVRTQAVKGQCKVSHILESGVALIFKFLLRNVESDIYILDPLDISYEFKIAIGYSYTVAVLRTLLLCNAYILIVCAIIFYN